MATLLWLFSRHDLNKTFAPVVTFLIFVLAYRGVWMEGLFYALSIGAWSALIFKGLIAAVLGLITLYIYSSLAQSIGI